MASQPRPLTRPDIAPLLTLNNEYAKELSWQEPAQFDNLLSSAFHTRTVDSDPSSSSPSALLVAFADSDTYSNPNFDWHMTHFGAGPKSFVYVDRIVVGPALQGRGAARALYADLFARAKREGYPRVVCEINVDPPNPVSTKFHAALGFKEVGRALLDNGKTVGYFENVLA